MPSEMKIHFCDLCNESVPQSDLDDARAFLRKGRVVCARCDRAMQAREASEAALRAGSEGSGDVAGPFGRAEPELGLELVREGAPPPASHEGAALAHRPVVTRSSAGAAGVTLAVLGLLATAGVALWLNDAVSKDREEDEARAAVLRSEVQASLRRNEASVRGLEETIRAWDARLAEALARERADTGARLESASGESRAVQARLEQLGGSLDELRAGLGALEKHEQELVMLGRRCDKLALEVRELAESVRLASERPPAPAVRADALPERGVQPAWIGLVEKLASENSTERWEAVDALGETRDPEVVPHLVPALRDKDLFVRMNAARKLEDLGSPKAIAGLIEALDDADSVMREAVYHALVTLTGRDFPFDPQDEDAAERAKRVKVWQDWWKKEREKLEGE